MAYLAAGMIVFWITTFVFVFSIVRRQRKLQDEIALLQEMSRDEAAKAA